MLHEYIISVIEDTCLLTDFKGSKIKLSIANYVYNGRIYSHRGGYGKLAYLSDNYQEYLLFLSDQDDIWVPNKVEVLIHAIGDQMLAYSDSELIDANGDLLHKKMSTIKNQLAYHTPIMYTIGAWAPGHAMLFKKELIDKATPFPTLVTHDFWLGFVATCYSRVVYVNEPLVHYRQHTQNAIGADTTKNKTASISMAQKKQKARARMQLLYNKVKEAGHQHEEVFEKINNSYASFSLSNNFKRAKLFYDHRNLILAYKKKSALLKVLFAVKMFFKID